MAVASEPSNDGKFKMLKNKPQESSIIRKDILRIIWTFLNVFQSKTYETIELFMLMLMSTSNKLCGAWMNIGRLQGRNLLGLMLIIYLLLLCGMAPSAAYADKPECSPGSRSPDDSVLDADDVKSVLFDSRLCNFSHQGYEHVCEDAFDHMLCPAIHLTGNKLSSLSPTVFQNVVNLREVFLDGNMFVEMPELINENNLMFLSINDNPLDKFSNQSTNNLPNLTILSVENCPNLLAIDEAAFENNLNLRVRFSGTPLQKLPCSNCFYVTLEGTDTVHLMCGSGSAIVTFESEIGENIFLNKTVETLLQTNDSIKNRLICKTQANSETHSTTHTSLTPTSATPTSATPTSVTPTSATPTAATLTSTTPTSATPASAIPASATPTSAILTLTTPTSATPTSATPTAVPKSATLTSAFLITSGVVLVLVIFVMVWYRKVIQSWCQQRSGIPNEILEMVPKNEP